MVIHRSHVPWSTSLPAEPVGLGRKLRAARAVSRRASVGGLLLALPLLACVGGEDFEERVAAPLGGRLEVDLDRGDGLRLDPGQLRVLSHEAHEVRLLAEAREWGASGVRFRVDRQGDTVRVVGRVSGAATWLFGGPRIDVQIWVPREMAIDLRSTGGAIRVEDTIGALRIQTTDAAIDVARAEGDIKLRSSGDVRLTEITGDVDVRLESGDIRVSWLSGDVELRTGEGEIDLDRVEGRVVARSERGAIALREVMGSVEAVTERGRVSATFAVPPEGRLETGRGSVHVDLPRSVGAALEAVARHGSVELIEDMQIPGRHTPQRVVGPLNGGGAPLRLFTARGGVELRWR